MKLKKVFASISAAAILTLGLSACGPSADEGSEELTKDTEATLTMAIWDKAQLPVVEKTIEMFREDYPNVTINVSKVYKDFWDKMRTAAEGNNLPDILWMNGPNIQLYAKNNQLADLTDLVESNQVDMSKYPQGLQDIYTVDGKVYGIPKDYDTIAIFYNKELFEQAGVEEPEGPWTWEEYKAKCAELKENLPDDVWPMVGSYIGQGQQTYYNTIAEADGYVIKDGKSGYADPGTIKGVQFWSDMVREGYLPPSHLQTDPNAKTIFENDKAAMYWSGSWSYNIFNSDGMDTSKVNVAPLPKGEKEASIIHGLAWSVSENSENKAVAKAFVALAGSEEVQKLAAEDGSVIPAYQGTAELWAAVDPNVNLNLFLEAAENYSVPYPISQNTLAWQALQDEYLVPAIDNGEDVTEACKQLAERMDELLAEEK